jgi:hypothetical protein
MARTRVFCIYFAALFLSVYFLPSLLRVDIFSNDMTEWTSWGYSYQDPQLFPHDANKTYWLANFPLGYKAIFKLLSPSFDTQIIGKSLGFALGALSTFLAFLLGRQVTGGKVWGGIAALALVVLCQFVVFNPIIFLNREAGGLPRGFGLPIVIFGIISALRRDLRSLGVSFFLAALFYPPACVILGTYTVLLLTSQFIKERVAPTGLLTLAVLSTGAAAFLVVMTLKSRATLGPLYSLDQMLLMPEFRPGGRLVLFYAHWWEYPLVFLQLDHGVISVIWFLFLVLTFAVGIMKTDRNLCRAEIALIPVSATINYVAAYLFALRLYEPSRYVMIPSQVLTLCCFPFFLQYLLGWVVPRLPVTGAWNRAKKIAWPAGIILVTTFAIGALSARVVLNRGGVADAMPPEVYEFLSTLPKDALIAATPTDGDHVPMRSRRSVLLLESSLYPYYPLFYDEMKDKFEVVLAAMYDTGPESVLALKRKYGARYLLVNNTLSRNGLVTDFQPFKGYELNLRARLGNKLPFVVSLAARAATVFQKADYSVLDLDRIEPLH